MSKSILTQADLKEKLHYDLDTGAFHWAIDVGQRGRAGKEAGSVISIDGYRRLRLNNKYYLCHRLAALYVLGKFPLEEIDHINMVKSDNSWKNLRLAERFQNQRNRPKNCTNKSGYKGVSWHKATKSWRAQANLNCKKYHLGDFIDILDAADAYRNFAKKNHGEFYREIS